MTTPKFITLGNAIRLMLLIGLVAFFLVIVQSCQKPKTGLDRFAVDSLKRLTELEAPPAQPSMEFRTFDGETMQLADYKGQVILLNVWATWCAPCLKEMPSLSQLQALRGGPEFQVVAVSLDRTAEETKLWLEDKDITNLTPWHDKSFGLNAAIKAPGLPMSIIYDRSGREIARLPGDAQWDSDEALALIDHVLKP